jgi:mono/diheme cytochrome c family protein
MKRSVYTFKPVAILGVVGMLALSGCVSDPDSPGLEYMPDMYRSPAIEAYVDYENMGVQSALEPPMGTIPFHSGEDADVYLPLTVKPGLGMDKTHGWYGFEQDPEGYKNSAMIVNPLQPTDVNLAAGEALYAKFCTHCHGEAGDGQGAIVKNGKIEGIPAYSNVTTSEGQMFYSITYGKGLMGAHASLLDRKERWQVVLHVRKLQNGGEYPSAAGSDSLTVSTDSIVVVENPVPQN